MDEMILPGATLGMLGGGQLGRMFVSAARTLGYRVMVLDPDPLSPAGEIADVHLRADYLDAVSLLRMGGGQGQRNGAAQWGHLVHGDPV